jgi:preprotein translocase subunit SecE
VSDERDPTGSAADPATGDADNDTTASNRGQTAVAARPLRPTGKRARRAAVEDETAQGATETTDDGGKNGKAKTAKGGDRPRNPFRFVITYLQQVVAELRKVIWPNRKQMSTYTTVVLAFLAFMVALIAGADWGLAWVISWAFGN